MGAVQRVTLEGRPHVAVDAELERTRVQPARFVVAAVLAPTLAYVVAGNPRRGLRRVGYAACAAVALLALVEWSAARRAL